MNHIMDTIKKRKHLILTVIFLTAMFFVGRAFQDYSHERDSGGVTQTQETEEHAGTEDASEAGERSGAGTPSGTDAEPEESPGTEESPSAENSLETMLLQSQNWGLGFGESGTTPTGNATPAELAKYDAYYVGNTEENIIYLTFDCGYENGNTEAILDALKNHNAPATFFVVGHYLESAPEIVQRMVEEGHSVGNHTYHHPDMSKLSDMTSFQEEIQAVEEEYREIIGSDMAPYYRPPQGKYSLQNLQMAQELGYNTFFWSLAYVDWNVDDQPSHEEAFEKLTGRIHPGAIVLLHNTSKTNGEILEELLCKWEDMGYRFGSLEELCGESQENQ